MLTVTKDMILPTTCTGSMPRPHWYTENLDGRAFNEALTHISFREQYLDALACYIGDQERAGLDILVDGDCRFDMRIGGRSWISYPLEHINGLVGTTGDTTIGLIKEFQPGTIMYELQARPQWPLCHEAMSRRDMEYDLLWKAAQQMTDRPVKFGTISSQCAAGFIEDHYYHDPKKLLFALCDVMNQELKTLAAAGCQIIQLEEPLIHFTGINPDATEADLQLLIEAFNREVDGVEAEIWCHTCWGNPSQQRVFTQKHSYQNGLPYLLQLNCDVVTLEVAHTEGSELPLLGKHETDKKFAIGVIDHRSLQVETAEEVAGLVREALKYVPPERLIISTDCGFGREGVPRRNALYKLVSLVRGTNIVRKELGLPEAEIRAADPRLVL
ncbi:cobalamin-independent methionine synthase II family protein [Acidobacteria bacterium AH-259-O06]|nr:cobalamin-independent methionine synthase II family protein [Acidobacteria bacterium AH-259-O06]